MPSRVDLRLSDELTAKLEAEIARKRMTVTEIVRAAVEEYFDRATQRQELELLMYEVIRTRAALLLRADMPARELSEKERAELLEEAGKDAEAYIEKRRIP